MAEKRFLPQIRNVLHQLRMSAHSFRVIPLECHHLCYVCMESISICIEKEQGLSKGSISVPDAQSRPLCLQRIIHQESHNHAAQQK